MEDKLLNGKIIEKIKKLLSLSESSNQHEARLAMLKAQELLVKHKLSLREIEDYKIDSNKIKDLASNITFTKAKWKAILAGLIADNFGCYIYFKTRNVNTITFFGREEDIAVCNLVLEYAVDCIESTIKRIQYKYKKAGYSTKGVANDYAIGFIKGMTEQFDEQKRTNQEWGLVLSKDKEVVDAYNKKVFKKSINTNTRYKGNSNVFNQGHKDGKKFSISDKISEGETQCRGDRLMG